MHTTALVLFSGGQDSTTCLAQALSKYQRVETIAFDYRQRHSVELQARLKVLSEIRTQFPPWADRLGDDHLLFLALAAALAYRRDLQVIVTGVCETDFSGYPDCRDDTMKAMQLALSLGMDRRFFIDTPLMWIDKAATWQRAHDIGERSDVAQGGDALVNLIIEHTHTCYLGDRVHRHAWGWGCGGCPACELRAQGYRRWIEHRMGMAGVPR